MSTLSIGTGCPDLETWIRLARGDSRLEVGAETRAAIRRSREVVEGAIARGDTVYGVNTGFGQLASVRISDDELAHLQENLVRSHAVGVGEDLDDDIVRLIMLMKVIALAEGFSGVRLDAYFVFQSHHLRVWKNCPFSC